MKILTINVNGFRSFRKRYGRDNIKYLIESCNPDIICMQEIKCEKSDIHKVAPKYGYVNYSSSNKNKKGYAGVAIWVRNSIVELHPPDVMTLDFKDYGSEGELRFLGGRVIALSFNKFTLVNSYSLNSGGKSENLRKLFDDKLDEFINTLINPILVGDLNVCHTKLDMYKWSSARNSAPGLMDYEIESQSSRLIKCDLVDSFRYMYPTEKSYTWFPPFNTKSFVDKMKGWRLDYILVTNNLVPNIKDVIHHNSWKDRVSDHFPVTIEINI